MSTRSVPGRPRNRMPGFIDSGVLSTQINPPSISGLKIWLLSDTQVFSDAGITPAVNNATVQQWNDQSGNSNNLSQANGGVRPTFKTAIVNGKPVVRFGGATFYMDSPTFGTPYSQPNTIFMVMNVQTSAGAHHYIFDTSDGNNANRVVIANSASVANKLEHYAGNWIGYSKTSPTGFLILTVYSNGASSEMFENGISKVIADAGTQAFKQLRLGAPSNPTQGAEFDVSEILVYNALLSASNRQSVEGYLRAKYATP